MAEKCVFVFRRRRGFTLIELLVAIGIVVALIGLLLPAIANVRESTRRASCASNLSQLANAIRAYGNDNEGYIPVGRVSAYYWPNYWFIDNTDLPKPAFYLFGSLYASGLLPDGRVAYCPSQQTTMFMFNQPANPWPPVVDPVKKPQIKAAYSMRPDYLVNFNLPGAKMPTQTALSGKCILCDVLEETPLLRTGHGSGLNRAMSDGSVQWVYITAQDSTGGTIASYIKTFGGLPTSSYAAKNAAISNIFSILDKN